MGFTKKPAHWNFDDLIVTLPITKKMAKDVLKGINNENIEVRWELKVKIKNKK